MATVGFGINSLWEKQKSPRSIHVCGAIECTVIRIQQQRMERKSYVLPLISLIYADLFNRCFLFVPVQVNTLQVWKDKKSHTLTLSLFTPHTVAQPHGLVCPGVWHVFARLMIVVTAVAFPERLDVVFLEAHPQLSSSCWIVWPQ